MPTILFCAIEVSSMLDLWTILPLYNGMAKNNQISEMIAEFGSRSEFAAAVGAELATVHKWAQSGRIPARWQKAAVDAARSKGLNSFNGDWMIAVHSEAQSGGAA